MTDANIWNQLFIWPILNVLVALYKFFEGMGIPGPLGFAVIGMTILIRLVLYPLMHQQMKSAKKMQAIKPHLDELSKKHKDDKTALQQAQLALYKEHGVNPAAGCLPLLIQMPVLIALYNVFYHVLNSTDVNVVVADINKVIYSPSLHLTKLNTDFFGMSLAVKPSQWQQFGVWLLLIPILTAALQYWQSRLMMPSQSSANSPQTSGKQKMQKAEDSKLKAEDSKPDTAAEMQKQMAIITPIMFGWFAFQFPLGLALYWNVFGLFGIMQQLAVNKSK